MSAQKIAETQEKKTAVKEIVAQSSPNFAYFFLLIISTFVTTLGVTLDSEAIVIGGMLLAPFLVPLMALGLGISTFSLKAILRSTISVFISVLLVVLISYITAMLLKIDAVPARQVFSRGEYSRVYLIVAFLSGLGASYLWIKPKLQSNLAGIAVSVSLIPPLCIVGISLATLNTTLGTETVKIFLANLAGIVLASSIVFSALKLFEFRGVQEKEIKHEESKN